jgi:hypothetical protein
MGVKDWKGMNGRKLWGRPRLKSQGEREREGGREQDSNSMGYRCKESKSKAK